MTISSQTSKAAFSGNGVSTAFPLPFPYLREADIKALLRQEGFETPLELGTHYTLSGAGSAQGGALVMNQPPATGQTLVVYRAPAIVQEVDYVENSAFPAETHEAALDLLTMICQSLQEQLGRAVLYPVSTPADDVLGSQAFLAATAQSRDAARSAEQNAFVSAGQASLCASRAAASAASAEAVANTADGLVKVSVGDAAARSLSSKLLAGNGLAEGIENPGGNEALRLAVALAEDSGLEFTGGLLRVKCGDGLALAASGLAADVGTGAGQLVQLDEDGRLPALDARNLTNVSAGDQTARDNAAMHAFMSWLSAGRATGPVPGGILNTFKTDELIAQVGATYDADGDFYTNRSAPVVIPRTTGTAISTGIGPEKAFDGVTSGSYTAAYCTYITGSLLYVGKSWGAVPQIVSGFDVYASSDYGWGNSASGVFTFTLLGSDVADAASATVIGSTTSAQAASAVASFRGNSETPYKYHWVKLTGTATSLGVVEVVLYTPRPATNMSVASYAVTLGAVPKKATVYLLHKAVDPVVLNTDLQVSVWKGSGWATSTDLTTLCAYSSEYSLLRATVDLSGLAQGSVLNWRVQTFNTKAQQVRGALLWAE